MHVGILYVKKKKKKKSRPTDPILKFFVVCLFVCLFVYFRGLINKIESIIHFIIFSVTSYILLLFRKDKLIFCGFLYHVFLSMHCSVNVCWLFITWYCFTSWNLFQVLYHIISWEPEGRYCSAKMFRWEPEGRYRCTKSMAIAPFWFSTEHLWTAITPFWLSTDNLQYVEFMNHHSNSFHGPKLLF